MPACFCCLGHWDAKGTIRSLLIPGGRSLVVRPPNSGDGYLVIFVCSNSIFLFFLVFFVYFSIFAYCLPYHFSSPVKTGQTFPHSGKYVLLYFEASALCF